MYRKYIYGFLENDKFDRIKISLLDTINKDIHNSLHFNSSMKCDSGHIMVQTRISEMH